MTSLREAPLRVRPTRAGERSRLEDRARVLKALGNATRLRIVEDLADGERCVCRIVAATSVSFSSVSKHLAILEEAGIVEGDKRGLQVFYRLRAPCVLRFMTCIEAVVAGRSRATSSSIR
ncbi:ArsR/SmtB family transcription factor [Rhodoplanes azumiensis]|uniref:ArsR/SmtB family transcription factor n=1 Tax=Rhodoplanes azumiensis TaxID=1897628 RepID=A0ABW5AH03_9BRAD